MEMDHLHAIFASHSSRLHSSLCLPALAPQRPSEAMPSPLAGNGVRWRHLTLDIDDWPAAPCSCALVRDL
eukprot:4319963-Prymnesium_polylepis.1